MAFVNKKWRRDIGDNAINAAARIGGSGIAAYAINKLQTIDDATATQSNLKRTLAIVGAPGITILGLCGDLFVENPIVRAFCQGLYTYGAARTIANMNDDLATEFGWKAAPTLKNNGVSGVPGIMNGVNRPAIMNGTSYIAPRQAIANAANTVKANTDINESKANALAGTMIQN